MVLLVALSLILKSGTFGGPQPDTKVVLDLQGSYILGFRGETSGCPGIL
jgi:hypothetical protein